MYKRQALPLLNNALSKEEDRWVKYDLEEAINLIALDSTNRQDRLAAIASLGDMRSAAALPILQELVNQPANDAEQKALNTAASAASRQIQKCQDITGGIEILLQGLSLSSILLLMALGLAIVFGMMGVINMAHGEMMMIGAYATFVVQEVFKAYLGEQFFD